MPVAAGFGEGRQIGVGRRDHQMAVERFVGAVADRADHRRAEGDVGHEVPVHHVEMDPVGAGRATASTSAPSREKSEDSSEAAMIVGLIVMWPRNTLRPPNAGA